MFFSLTSLLKNLIFFSLFLIPLLPASFGFGYEHIKVIFFIFFVNLLILLFILSSNKFQISKTNINFAALFFISILLITSLTGININQSLFGTSPYFQGWIVYLYLFIFSLIISLIKIDVLDIFKVLALSSIFVSIISIRDFIFLNLNNTDVPIYAGRVISTFGQPNFYASFLLMNLPLIYFLYKKQTDNFKNIAYISLVLSLLGILVSQSRSAFLILATIVLFFLINKSSFKKIIYSLITITVLFSLFISIYTKSGFFWKEIVEPRTNQWLLSHSPSKRTYVWEISAELFKQRILLGYGLENIETAYSDFFKNLDYNFVKVPYYYSLKDLSVNRSHNLILDILLFSGVGGLVAWIFLNIFVLKKLNASKLPHSKYLITGMLIFLFWTMFQNYSIIQLIYFWTLVGIVSKN